MKTKIALALSALCLLALVVFAEDREGQTIRYRGGTVLKFDTQSSIKDEDGAWMLTWDKMSTLSSLANHGSTQAWTNDTSGGNQVLENSDQSSNLAFIDYQNGQVVFSTWGTPYAPLAHKNNVILGNVYPQDGATNCANSVVEGTSLLQSATNTASAVVLGNSALDNSGNLYASVAIGLSAGGNVLNDGDADNSINGSVFIGAHTGPNSSKATGRSVYMGAGAISSSATATNVISIGRGSVATAENGVAIGNALNDFNVGVASPGAIVSLGGMRTNSATLDISTSAFTLNAYVTNGNRRAWVSASFTLTAAVARTAAVGIYVDQAASGTFANLGPQISAGPLASLVGVQQLSTFLSPGARFVFTNLTSGSGATAAIVANT